GCADGCSDLVTGLRLGCARPTARVGADSARTRHLGCLHWRSPARCTHSIGLRRTPPASRTTPFPLAQSQPLHRIGYVSRVRRCGYHFRAHAGRRARTQCSFSAGSPGLLCSRAFAPPFSGMAPFLPFEGVSSRHHLHRGMRLTDLLASARLSSEYPFTRLILYIYFVFRFSRMAQLLRD